MTWIPHSLALGSDSHHHRPERSSSPGLTARVPGAAADRGVALVVEDVVPDFVFRIGERGELWISREPRVRGNDVACVGTTSDLDGGI